MPLRRAAVVALGLVTALPALAACGEDPSAIEDGDVVPARSDAQFADGTPSSLALPIGRLEVTLGEPVDRVGSDDTRELIALEAPAGSVFVPITWQYDAGTFEGDAEFLAADASPVIDLVSDGASYRLPAPEEEGEGSESFYVVVQGDGDRPTLVVDYDGVRQTLDLTTGEREPGRARALYDRVRERRTRPCGAPSDVTVDVPESSVDLVCRVRRVERRPYAGGAWADGGDTWLVVTVATTLRRFAKAGDAGSGAFYLPTALLSTDFRLGRSRPAKVIEGGEGTSCPDPRGAGCSTEFHLVFDVGSDHPPTLDVRLVYDTRLESSWGPYDGRETLRVPVDITVGLRRPAARS